MDQFTYERCYAMLGLSFGATADQVKQAWKTRTLKNHPDQFAGDPKAHARATAAQVDINVARDQLLKWFKQYPGQLPPQQPAASYTAPGAAPSQSNRGYRPGASPNSGARSRPQQSWGANRAAEFDPFGVGAWPSSSARQRRPDPGSSTVHDMRRDWNRSRQAYEVARARQRNQLVVVAGLCFTAAAGLSGLLVGLIMGWF
jgi:curved DNA-binding protein CbpA